MKYYYYGKDASVEIIELAVSQNIMKIVSSSGKDSHRIVSQEAKKEHNNSS